MFGLHNIEIPIKGKGKIVCDVRYPISSNKLLPLVVIVHGFTGHKDWGFLPYLSQKLAENDFISIVLNFTTDCVDPDNDWFINVEKFATFTISQEVEELNLLINKILAKEVLPEFIQKIADCNKIFLVGQSLGGAVSLIYAATFNRVEKIVLLGTVGTLFRYTKRQVSDWKEKGVWVFTNTRSGQELKINFSYYQDLVENDYKLENYLSSISIPILYIHGSEDLTVPLKEIESLIRRAKNPFVELKIIENTGHTFGIDHPFVQPSKPLIEAIDATIKFFKL